MTQLISNWLMTRLGISLKNFPEEFPSTAKDGYILSLLLLNYDIIDQSQLRLIVKSTDEDECRENFSHIIHWLKRLDITVTNEAIDKFVKEDKLALINLFYKVFLALFGKGKVDFICKQQLRQKLKTSTGRFKVIKVFEEEKQSRKCSTFNKRSFPIWAGYDIIHWHQDRLESIINTCNKARIEYALVARTRGNSTVTEEPPKWTAPREKSSAVQATNVSEKSLDLSYDELFRQLENAKCSKFQQPDSKEAERILRVIKKRHKTGEADIELKKQFHRDILSQFYKRTLEAEKVEREKAVIEKLAKQSVYEKQMVKKMEQVKLQKSVMLENHRIFMEEVMKETEDNFLKQLLDKDKEFAVEEYDYYLEKERALDLHRKLYAEKLELKAARTYARCWEIMADIVDFSMLMSQYVQLYGETPTEVTKKTWQQLFISEQQLENFLPQVDDITEDPEKGMEEIYKKEVNRQEEIDKMDFEDYLYLRPPWNFDYLELDEKELQKLQCGKNVLSYIVYRLLDLKYPLPPSPPPPDLPKLEFCVCVEELKDVTAIPLLARLLERKDIKVFQIQDAVCYCVQAFREEMHSSEGLYDEDPPELLEAEKSGDGLKVMKTNRKSKSKLRSKTNQRLSEESHDENVVTVATQTPKLYPFEEISLSPAAELGKFASEELEGGMALTDFLMVRMFVEFLKSQKDFTGWVLINFPTTYEQAVQLEEAMTGVPVPGKTYKITTSGVSLCDIFEKDVNPGHEMYRTSVLLKPLQKKMDYAYYRTVLTAFIKLIHQDDMDTDETLMERIEDEQANYTRLEKFYADMGCLYTMYYTTFNFNAVKQLAKLIIGDFSLPPKTSVQLFGDTINYIMAEKILADARDIFTQNPLKMILPPKSDMKKPKTVYKLKKGESSVNRDNHLPHHQGKHQKNQPSNQIVIRRADKETQIPEEEVEEIEVDELPEPPKPGEQNWQYLSLEIPEDIADIMTNLWENIEATFVDDMKQVLFTKRVLMDKVVPYVKFLKDHMDAYMDRPDQKQIHLRKFQQTYNSFDNDMRIDEEFKAEQHYRVNELRLELMEICETSMMESEEMRAELINENWTPRQMTEYANNMINALQLEMDMTVDTIGLINDYYCSMVSKMLAKEVLTKDMLSRFDLEDQRIQSEVNNLLKSVKGNEDTDYNPFTSRIQNLIQKCETSINHLNNQALHSITRMKELFNPIEFAHKAKKGEKTLTIQEPSVEVCEHYDDILSEWRAALEGETVRIHARLKLIETDALLNLSVILSFVKKTFHDIFLKIRDRYAEETDSINKACDMFRHAIESEVSVQHEIFLKSDQFIVDMKSILVPDVKKEKKIVTVSNNTYAFSVVQLKSLMRIFFDLAPEGLIPERSFIFLLQDVIFWDEAPLAPKTWCELHGRDVEKLSIKLFGQLEVIDWKEFIARNLMIRYPTAEELLDITRKYTEFDIDITEIINKDQYDKVKLWFEDDENLTSEPIKELIYDLFKVSGGDFNYTPMLLTFCKGETAAEGFVKALTVSAQEQICLDYQMGEMFVECVLEQRRLHEEEVKMREKEQKELIKCVKDLMTSVISRVVHECDEVIITELTPESRQSIKRKLLKDRSKSLHQTPKSKSSSQQIKKSIITETSSLPEKLRVNIEDTTESLLEQDGVVPENDVSKVVVTPEPSPEDRISEAPEPEEDQPDDISDTPEPPPLLYFLPLVLVERVLNATMHWYGQVQNIEDKSTTEEFAEIYTRLRDERFNMQVPSHELLNNKDFIILISKTPKFVILHPPDVVLHLIQNQRRCD